MERGLDGHGGARRRRSSHARPPRCEITIDGGALPPCDRDIAVSSPRLALADDPTVPKWRNDAEAVTPHDRENGDFAIQRTNVRDVSQLQMDFSSRRPK
ncbi:unnamed protein product [Colias eurytheme]|nr:unnamed protein product [Colias eurytheme]